MTIRKSRSHDSQRPRIAGWAAVLFLAMPVSTAALAENSLARPDEPIVFAGDAHPLLLGAAPDRLVAFRWESAWVRVPIQVDERAVVDFATIYGASEPSGFTVLTYVDTETFTGPDSDPSIDPDDEIVLMAREAGVRAPSTTSIPTGVVPGGGVEISVSNASNGGAAWIYLFQSDGTLPPLPPSDGVRYAFLLLSGDYKTTYDVDGSGGVGNPEASTVEASAYRVAFTDRWMRTETGIRRGGAPGNDLLERHRNRFLPNSCSRTEWTFSRGEGAFIVNKSGPVRALRGYVGANSGTTTHRIHAFYDATETIRTVLRVHDIPGIMDYFDWTSAAGGMTWRSDRNSAGVPVDARPDVVDTSPHVWESLTGAQGTIAMVPTVETDIPGFDWITWYSDSEPARAGPCPNQGDDDVEFGASGLFRDGSVPNTDPAVPGDVHRLVLKRAIRYLAPNAPPGAGADFEIEVRNPLTLAFAAYDPPSTCPDADADGSVVCADGCAPPPNATCGDCDDADPARHPGAAETCDGVDQDCDGLVDEGLPTTVWYRDADGDGHGSPSSTTETCGSTPPAGYVAGAGDCDDADPARHPGAAETCDGVDQDCDSLVDEGLPDCGSADCSDRDGDGYAVCDASCSPPTGVSCGDCDDVDATRHPAAEEICDGVDQDCDGTVDEGLPTTDWYRDGDGDGHGSELSTISTCDLEPPSGYVATSGDCDDADPSRHPGAAERCNGLDDDCSAQTSDGVAEPWIGEPCDGADRDDCPDGGSVCRDGVRSCDDDPLSSVDVCDGADNDCSGSTDDPRCADHDVDGDGRVSGAELAWLGRAFGACSAAPESEWWARIDYDGSGCVDGEDLAILANFWGLSCSAGVLDCR